MTIAKILAATLAVAWGRQHEGPELPMCVGEFYDAVAGNPSRLSAARCLRFDTVWVHTDLPTVTGPWPIAKALTGNTEYTMQISHTKTVQAIGNGKAVTVSVERDGMRDTFFVIDSRLKAVWTTRSHPKDANATAVVEEHPFSPSFRDETEDVKAAVEKYFDSFQNNSGEEMANAFSKISPYVAFDYHAARKAPYPCMVSARCDRTPSMNDWNNMLGAFKAFACSGCTIALSSTFHDVTVVGDMAFAHKSSNGCEGRMVTPTGSPPMANRELLVATKEQGQWKLRTYVFTWDPESKLTPPFPTCVNAEPPPSKVLV